MADINKEFLDDLEKEFNSRYSSNKKIQTLVKNLRNSKATAEDAFEYAKEVGNLRKNVLHDCITDDVLNNEYLGYSNASTLFNDVLYKDYELINQYCKNAFTQVNKKAGINLNGISTKYDQNKTDGIIECAVKGPYETVRAETEEAVYTHAKCCYDTSVKRNAEFQYKSGLRPKIIRTTIGKTCKWCQSLAGTYDYYDVSDTGNDVFRRHSNCDCLVVYSPKKGKYQSVWSKNEMNEQQYQNRMERIVLASTKSSENNGFKMRPYSDRGISIPEKVKEIISNTKNSGDYCFVGSSVSDDELRIMSVETGDEYAKIVLKNETVIIHGRETKTNIPEEILERMKNEGGILETHSHPFIGDYRPSKEDQEAFSQLSEINGQKTSKIISPEGIVTTYNEYGIIDVQENTDYISDERIKAWNDLFGE